ncbi:RluA family pseudouridine synthase [Aerococcaceae bacterium DSM 111021]|nr:RluA family pseudouridine synthase [Aerococcaceae bacterium DSM 111021]
MKVPILYEDNHLMVVEKPVNIPVQEDTSKDLDLFNYLKKFIKVRDNKPGNVYLGLIHRLDRPVGGAMVFAKTSKAASRLSNTLRKHELNRYYLATVMGKLPKKEDKITHYLWKDRKINQVYAVDRNHPEAKKAELSYEVLDYKEGMSLVRVQLHTGRSHQIRVQFQALGTPLYGDQKYGDKRIKPNTQIALWANEIEIPHPTLKEVIKATSNPPRIEPWNLFLNN